MNGEFEVLDAREPAQRSRWLDLWGRWPRREVQAHPAYLELFLGPGELARAAILESASGAVLYPFIERPLPDALTSAHARADVTSPYGYGGPFAWGDLDVLATQFWPAYESWAREHSIVTEFIRFAVGTDDLLPYPGERVLRQDNIIVPTDLAPDVIWTQYAHKVRKNVNKARSSGVRIEIDHGGVRLDEFCRIYIATMSRRDASKLYFFPEEFFERVAATLKGRYVYFHAIFEERVISTELALISADRMYSFLGGTAEDAFDVRPNDLLKHEMIVWAHNQGLRQFVLGGGYRPDDGIFRYKRGFAPEGRVPFFTGQRVFDRTTYERLAEQHAEAIARDGASVTPGYFPAYRAPARTSPIA